MARMSLFPGYRFHPTDVELVMYYLKRKVLGKRLHVNAVAEVNIYMFSPWDLPDKSALKSKDLEWFFFCPREKKYASGARVKRATEIGYWKTTGKDRPVSYKGKNVGIVKTLVFHLGPAPKGERTDWVMHEYRILDEQSIAAGVKDNYVLCKVFQKNGPGPKNGAQYGAPYNEADWIDSDDDDTQADHTSLRSDGALPTAPILIGNGSSIGTFSVYPGSTFGFPLIEKGPSPALDLSTSAIPGNEIDDEFARLLALVENGKPFFPDENAIEQDPENYKQTNVNWDGIFGDLSDLDGWAPITGNALESSDGPMNDSSLLGEQQECDYCLDYMLPDDGSFIELDDLQVPLNELAGFSGTDHFTEDDFFGLDDFLQKANDLCSEGSFARSDQYASSTIQPPVLSKIHNQPDNCLLNALHVVDEREFFGARNPDISDSIQDTERGAVKRILMSSRSIPAAEHLIDAHHSLYPSLLFGDSSIHIKAEVTHRDGECTNDALPPMMEESCSFFCWKILLKLLCSNLLPSYVEYQFNRKTTCFSLFWRFSCDMNGYSCIIFINDRERDACLNCLLHCACLPYKCVMSSPVENSNFFTT